MSDFDSYHAQRAEKQSEMNRNEESMFCKYCGKEIPCDAYICTGCGRKTENCDKWDNYGCLVTLAIFIPIVGVIAGIVGLAKGKAGSGFLLGISIVFWVFFTLILLAIGAS